MRRTVITLAVVAALSGVVLIIAAALALHTVRRAHGQAWPDSPSGQAQPDPRSARKV